MRVRTALCLAAFLIASVFGVALPASAADYAPLDCSRARLPSERAICSNYGLGQREARMATLYDWTTSLVAMGQRGDMQGAQRDWLQERENCGDRVGCLTERYDARIRDLNSTIEGIASRGPY